MENVSVTIITRDVNGKRTPYYLTWNEVCSHINKYKLYEKEVEILLVAVDDHLIYSALGSNPITWEDVLGFFA